MPVTGISRIVFSWTLILTVSCSGWPTDGKEYPLIASRELPIEASPDFMGEARGHDVILITIDTLRASHLHCYGYPLPTSPFLDSLAHEGFLFETVYTPIPRTLPAHASLLTSLYPYEHGIADNALYANPLAGLNLLPDRMRDLGYETAAFVSAYVLHSKFGLSEFFDHYDDSCFSSPGTKQSGTEAMLRRDASATIDRIVDWLGNGRQDRQKPLFLWIHLFDCHPAFTYREEHYDRMVDNAYYERFRNRELGIAPEYVAKYDAAIRTVDDQIRRLVTLWESLASSDPLVIITADHGESMGEHRLLGHIKVIYEQTLRVPLIVHAPWIFEEYSGSVKAQCSTLDIFPTLMKLLGCDTARLQGKPLFPVQEITTEKALAEIPSKSTMVARRAVMEGNWKLVVPKPLLENPFEAIDPHDPDVRNAIEEITPRLHPKLARLMKDERFLRQQLCSMLFDLSRDPGENNNLAEEFPETVTRLVSLLRDVETKARYLRPLELEEGEAQALKALGYIQQ